MIAALVCPNDHGWIECEDIGAESLCPICRAPLVEDDDSDE